MTSPAIIGNDLNGIITSKISDYQFKEIQLIERLEVEQNVAWNRFYEKYK